MKKCVLAVLFLIIAISVPVRAEDTISDFVETGMELGIKKTLSAATKTADTFSEESMDAVSTDKSVFRKNGGLELYRQDGYTISAVGFEKNDTVMHCSTLELCIQNLTPHDVILSDADSFSYINDSMISLDSYFEVASGKTKTDTLYIDTKSLQASGISTIEDITLNFDVYDNESYMKLTRIGPLYISIDGKGNVSNKKIHRDTDTIREVQSLLKEAGYDCGAPDGVAGKKTNTMILKYERDHGLQEDTDITDELLDALRNN